MSARIMIRVGEEPNGGPASAEWLHRLGSYSNVVRTVRYPQGDWSLEWEMDLYRGTNPSVLKAGRVVEAWLGGVRIWGGTMDRPDHESGKYTASGFCRQAERAHALDLSGKATANLDLAIYCASNLGRKLWNIGSLEVTQSWAEQLPTPTETQTLADLADALCLINGRRWWVDSHRGFWTRTDPTTPTVIVNTSEHLGVSGDDQVTDLAVGYINPSGARRVKVIATPGVSWRNERLVDATGLGPITQAAATNLGNQVLSRSGANSVFTGSITLSPGQAANLGGARLHLSALAPGQIYRFNGQRDPRNGAMVTDALIGEVVWREDAGTVEVTPFAAEREDMEAVVESLGVELVA